MTARRAATRPTAALGSLVDFHRNISKVLSLPATSRRETIDPSQV